MDEIILIFVEGVLPQINKREKYCFYIHVHDIVYWDGKYLKCIHKKQKNRCVECKGASICEHKKRKSCCIECNGSEI